MARNRSRVWLSQALKLTIAGLRERDLLDPNRKRGGRISWSNDSGGVVGRVDVVSDLRDDAGSVYLLSEGDETQRIAVLTQPRHFGGLQWYFVCPRTARLCSVLYCPPGVRFFASRQAFGRQVTYLTQAQTESERAWTAQRKIVAKVRALGGDGTPGDLTDKPPGMRWRTFEGLQDRSNYYDSVIDGLSFRRIERLVSRKNSK